MYLLFWGLYICCPVGFVFALTLILIALGCVLWLFVLLGISLDAIGDLIMFVVVRCLVGVA